ncbi:hypothetical protein AURDEDRAFT_178598 [Auricularia subglabra TFB-10046 SS5]|uniref:Uncharacterized protein n=1 Tax=Auricularia subglabra (strain TFB-10046 / SS5) TaxID=717982 RepID=J0D185_AURST|nr:hypothetical protein AURDEDRAFT_178598 [Auricularia subglabra TFB-10046 SS5]
MGRKGKQCADVQPPVGDLEQHAAAIDVNVGLEAGLSTLARAETAQTNVSGRVVAASDIPCFCCAPASVARGRRALVSFLRCWLFRLHTRQRTVTHGADLQPPVQDLEQHVNVGLEAGLGTLDGALADTPASSIAVQVSVINGGDGDAPAIAEDQEPVVKRQQGPGRTTRDDRIYYGVGSWLGRVASEIMPLAIVVMEGTMQGTWRVPGAEFSLRLSAFPSSLPPPACPLLRLPAAFIRRPHSCRIRHGLPGAAPPP